MDDLLNQYIYCTYSPEMQEDIFQAFGLFQVFNHLEPFPLIHDVLSLESVTETTTVADDLTSIILNGQAYILDRHGVSLGDETTLAFNNVILRGLFQLLKLEEPQPVLSILESQENHETMFANIIELLTSTPVTTTLQIVDNVRPVFISLLSEFLYTQESDNISVHSEIGSIKEKVLLFKEVFGINEAIRIILDANIIMGEDFKLYLPIYDDLRSSIRDEKVLVETLLFLLIYSRDGVDNPVAIFENYSDYLVSDLTLGNRLRNTLASMHEQMLRLKETAKNES